MEHQATTTEKAPPESSGNSSRSKPDPGEIGLMRIQLAKLGRLSGGESEREVSEQYVRWRDEQAAPAETLETKRERAFLRDADSIRIDSIRAALTRLGEPPAVAMTEEAMRGRMAELQARANADHAKRVEASESMRRRSLAESLFLSACCPDRHTVNLSRIDDGQCAEWIRLRNLLVDQSCFANGYLVALLGTRGVGKTQLVVSAIHRCCERLLSCRYTKAIGLFRDIRRAYVPVARGEAGIAEDDIISTWEDPDLLVIDECHQRGETRAEDNALVNLLDLRYDRRLCTILIANQTKQDFASAMGDSVVSRIHETGEAFVCEWESFRKPGQWRQAAGAERRRPDLEEH